MLTDHSSPVEWRNGLRPDGTTRTKQRVQQPTRQALNSSGPKYGRASSPASSYVQPSYAAKVCWKSSKNALIVPNVVSSGKSGSEQAIKKSVKCSFDQITSLLTLPSHTRINSFQNCLCAVLMGLPRLTPIAVSSLRQCLSSATNASKSCSACAVRAARCGNCRGQWVSGSMRL